MKQATGGTCADRRAHRPRDAGRSRALSRGRHGRLSLEADRRRRAHRHDRAIRRRQRERSAAMRPRRRAVAAESRRWRLRRAAALAHTGGDRDLLKKVIAVFRSTSAASLRHIDTAIRRRDGEALRLAAHAIKGPIATVGSRIGREIAAELEQMGRPASSSRPRAPTAPERSPASTRRGVRCRQPVAPALAAVRAPPASRPPNEATMSRILVVDDDPTTRLLVTNVLKSAGFTTSEASDGVQALKSLRANTFDLLLLDVWMPRMNGLELLAKLRTRKAAASRGRHDVRRRAGDAAEGGAGAGVPVPAQAGERRDAAADGAGRPRRPRGAGDRGAVGAPGMGRTGRAVHARGGGTPRRAS